MSITRGFFCLLIDARKKGFIQGKSILQLGRQSAFFTFDEATQWLRDSSLSIPEVKPELAFDPVCRKRNCINDITVFSLLGFETVHSLDISDYESATYIQDLNLQKSEKVAQQYDVIYDGGTLEHVFSTLQALKNIYTYLKVGGTVVHVNPAHNHLDHGFYSFSPQMYHDYYTANSYKILDSYILESFKNGYDNFHVYRYKPGCLELLQFGGYGREMLCNWFMAQKQSDSSCDKIPSQGCSRLDNPGSICLEETSSVLSFLRTLLKKSRGICFLVRCMKKAISFITFYRRRFIQKIKPMGASSKLQFIAKY